MANIVVVLQQKEIGRLRSQPYLESHDSVHLLANVFYIREDRQKLSTVWNHAAFAFGEKKAQFG